jgi:PAS domain S-box-containing protein
MSDVGGRPPPNTKHQTQNTGGKQAEWLNRGLHAELKKMENGKTKIEHLNLALRAIRNVNRLLVKEKDSARLLQAVCDTLVENRGYDKVWIVVLDEAGRIDRTAESGIGREFCTALTGGRFKETVTCAAAALAGTEAVLIKNPSKTCGQCPLADQHAGWGVLTVALNYGGESYGLLSVSIPRELVSDDVEQALVEEIAGDIAYGLYRIRREERHELADTALRERVKELNYLFSLSSLIERPRVTLAEILQGSVDLLPSAMQYPQITCARILIDDRVFQTANFAGSPWKLSNDILVDGRISGALEVYLLEEKMKKDLGPFLKEEVALVISVARRIGRTIERKQGRKALEESEKRFRDLVENSLTCISIIQNDKIVYKNPEYERLFGSSNNSFILPDYGNIHPEDVAAVDTAIRKYLEGSLRFADMEFRFYPSQNVNAGVDITGNLKWFHCRVSTIEHRGKNAILVNLMDISRAKELEHLLRIQDKMTSLGRVAAGIAHEIRNPLSGINIYLKALEKIIRKSQNDEKISSILSQLQSASNKIESVIRRVMDFSRPSEPAFIRTDINRPVEEAVNLSAVTLRKSGIQLKMKLCPDLPECLADPHMIEQVILNLVSNASEAMKHMEGNKKIEIDTELRQGAVCIRVSDSGPGVPEKMMENIFDPFYTTKSSSSGIGLSICHRIVTDHGGTLDVSTADIGGAAFLVKIPAERKTG